MEIKNIIKELEKIEEKNYDISFNVEPIIKEYRSVDETGKRYIYYERTITIRDIDPTDEQDIKYY